MKNENSLDVDNFLFWDNKYKINEFSWDVGYPTPFFVDWSKTIENKKSKKILIPGCGLGHDVIYLSKLGFDVYACDFSSTAVKILRNKVEKNNLSTKVIKENFFKLSENFKGYFDYIIEYTFYCAINPSKRPNYIEECSKLLKDKGKLVGIMLPIGNVEVASRPPFEVKLSELENNFLNFFKIIKIKPNHLSIKKRKGIEYIVEYQKYK